jgi:hypothetical protein
VNERLPLLSSPIATVVAIAASAAAAAGALALIGVGGGLPREERVQADADRVFDANLDSFKRACRPGLIDILITDYVYVEPVVPDIIPSDGPYEVTELVIEPDSAHPVRLALPDVAVFDERLYERIGGLCEEIRASGRRDAS